MCTHHRLCKYKCQRADSVFFPSHQQSKLPLLQTFASTSCQHFRRREQTAFSQLHHQARYPLPNQKSRSRTPSTMCLANYEVCKKFKPDPGCWDSLCANPVVPLNHYDLAPCSESKSRLANHPDLIQPGWKFGNWGCCRDIQARFVANDARRYGTPQPTTPGKLCPTCQKNEGDKKKGVKKEEDEDGVEKGGLGSSVAGNSGVALK
jgi:hypothetical protein